MADHLEEAATTMMVLRMRTEMTRQVVDALREEGNLNAGRTGVPFVGPVLVDRGSLVERHRRCILSRYPSCRRASWCVTFTAGLERAIAGSTVAYST